MKKQEKTFVELCQSRLLLLETELFKSSFSICLSPVELSALGYQACDSLLSFIQLELGTFEFASETERLSFYKDTLSSAVALKVFCRERYFMQAGMPGGTRDCLDRYYKTQLSQLTIFEDRFGFFRGYFRSGMQQLDDLYYLPDKGMETVMLPEVVVPEKLELGCCSYLLARFKANDLLRRVLVAKLEGKVDSDRELEVEAEAEAKPIVQTMFNLSVDQLGMGARAMLDAAVITGRSFQQVCEDLAPRVSTPEKQLVSAGSIRSNAYTGEDIDKHALIRVLEKMIRLIKEY
jgi:hypothetical protein